MSHRRELAGAGLLFVLGLGSVAGLQAVMGREAVPPPSSPRRPDLIQEVTLSVQALLKTASELRRAADVVVDRQADGSLMVSGRAVKSPVRLGSLDELRAFLRGLPTPGSAFVTATSSSLAERASIAAPPSVETAAALAELRAALAEAGFHEARGNLRSFLPLDGPQPKPGLDVR